jgi:hypothetical protein
MIKYADLPNGIWGKAVMHAVYLKNRCPSTRINYLSPLQFRTGEATDFTRLRVFGCPAQIFIRSKERPNDKLSSRSEKGTFIGMSQLGNGFIFRIRRLNQTVEIDSADCKFNETFSDCRDRQGRIIKGGRVLQPDLINELDMATDVDAMIEKWNPTTFQPKPIDKPSRFSSTNSFENLNNDSNDKGSRFAGRNRFSNLTSMNEIESDNESNESNEIESDNESNESNESIIDEENNGKRLSGCSKKINDNNQNSNNGPTKIKEKLNGGTTTRQIGTTMRQIGGTTMKTRELKGLNPRRDLHQSLI